MDTATDKRILFIRKRITREHAINLDTILLKIWPHLDYLILALDGSEEAKSDWQLDRVRNFYLRQPVPYVWKGDNDAWKEIFEDLHLETKADVKLGED